jgi:hypothetical protein
LLFIFKQFLSNIFIILVKCCQTETSRRGESAGCFQGKHSILYLQATRWRIVHDPLRQLWRLYVCLLYHYLWSHLPRGNGYFLVPNVLNRHGR